MLAKAGMCDDKYIYIYIENREKVGGVIYTSVCVVELCMFSNIDLKLKN